jgi:hypothetical protein
MYFDDDTINSVRDAVRRGAALLDERGPSDWRDKIDVSTLHMRKPSLCVLGQVYGCYTIGLARLGVQRYMGPEGGYSYAPDWYGFNGSYVDVETGDYRSVSDTYSGVMGLLTDEWIDFLAEADGKALSDDDPGAPGSILGVFPPRSSVSD